MRYTIDHDVDSSVFLWLDYLLIERNLGFDNYSGAFRPVTSSISGKTAYAAPHRQFVYDSSVTGAIVPSGVLSNGSFVPAGTGVAIDYVQGQALFPSSAAQPVTARYSFKEINVYVTDQPEEKILFENRFVERPRSSPPHADFLPTDLVYPCILIKSEAGDNVQESFDGMARTTMPVRLVFLAENPYQYRAVTSVLRDQQDKHIVLFPPEQLPFDQYFNLKSGSFDYSQAITVLQEDQSRLAYLREVAISPFPDRVNSQIGPKVRGAFIDIDLELMRFPHAQ